MKNVAIKAVLLVGALVAAAACGSSSNKPADGAAAGGREIAAGEVCPPKSAGPPVECPEGCEWNNTECRAKRPIVIFDLPAPTAAPSVTTTKVQPPSTP